MSGKGSGRRPQCVDDQALADSWSRIFGAKSKDSPNSLEADNGNGSEPDPQGQGQAEGVA
jgi:hypothetical protein